MRMNCKPCPVCKQMFPALRDYFPPHKGLSFDARPCKSCRYEQYKTDQKTRYWKHRIDVEINLRKIGNNSGLNMYTRNRKTIINPSDGKIYRKCDVVKIAFTNQPDLLYKNVDDLFMAFYNAKLYVSRTTINRVRRQILDNK